MTTNPGGKIRLEAEHVQNQVVIRIIDNGIGLSPALLPRVFDLFVQADQTLDRTQGGLGIGLTLAKNLVEMHGGTIDVKSTPGEGSEFEVRLPTIDAADAAAGPPVPDEYAGHQSRLRVLVLEDNVDAAQILEQLLELNGHEVQMAIDGESGLEVASSFHPHVVLCDIGLPRMNGYDVAVRLRQQPEFRATRLIALTGYGQEDDRARAREAGFDYHLTKPVEPEVLLKLIGDSAELAS
jgi:CheY-like chemotaxis protein